MTASFPQAQQQFPTAKTTMQERGTGSCVEQLGASLQRAKTRVWHASSCHYLRIILMILGGGHRNVKFC